MRKFVILMGMEVWEKDAEQMRQSLYEYLGMDHIRADNGKRQQVYLYFHETGKKRATRVVLDVHFE